LRYFSTDRPMPAKPLNLRLFLISLFSLVISRLCLVSHHSRIAACRTGMCPSG
jgi:hypothetical protein